MGTLNICQKTLLAPLALVGLLFLPSCSSSAEPADKPQAQTECEIAIEKSAELINKVEADTQSGGPVNAKVSLLTWAFYTLEKKECFSSETVAQAQTAIALVQK